jgi:hypothetical protein
MISETSRNITMAIVTDTITSGPFIMECHLAASVSTHDDNLHTLYLRETFEKTYMNKRLIIFYKAAEMILNDIYKHLQSISKKSYLDCRPNVKIVFFNDKTCESGKRGDINSLENTPNIANSRSNATGGATASKDTHNSLSMSPPKTDRMSMTATATATTTTTSSTSSTHGHHSPVRVVQAQHYHTPDGECCIHLNPAFIWKRYETYIRKHKSLSSSSSSPSASSSSAFLSTEDSYSEASQSCMMSLFYMLAHEAAHCVCFPSTDHNDDWSFEYEHILHHFTLQNSKTFDVYLSQIYHDAIYQCNPSSKTLSIIVRYKLYDPASHTLVPLLLSHTKSKLSQSSLTSSSSSSSSSSSAKRKLNDDETDLQSCFTQQTINGPTHLPTMPSSQTDVSVEKDDRDTNDDRPRKRSKTVKTL